MSAQKRPGRPAGSGSSDAVEPSDLPATTDDASTTTDDAPAAPDDATTPLDDASATADDAAAETADTPVATAPTRPGSAAAAAAARARRIGGRPTTARKPETDEPDDSSRSGKAAVAAGTTSTVSIAKKATGSDEAPEVPAKAKKRRIPKRGEKNKVDKKSPAADAPAAASVAAAEGEDAPGRSRTLVRWAPATVLIVAAIVLAVVVAVSTHGKRWDRPSSNAERDQVLAAAKMCIVDTNSYSYKNIDAFAKKGSACAAGKFGQQFTKTINDLIRKNAPKSKQIQSLQVNTAGIMNVTDDNQWDVLVYGQLKVSNTANAKGAIDPFASVARVVDIGGKWRISNLCTAQFNGPINACY